MTDTYDVLTLRGKRYAEMRYVERLEAQLQETITLVRQMREQVDGRDALITTLKAQNAQLQGLAEQGMALAGRHIATSHVAHTPQPDTL